MLLIGIITDCLMAISSSLFSTCSLELKWTRIGLQLTETLFSVITLDAITFSICLSTIRMWVTHLLHYVSAAQRHPAFIFNFPLKIMSCPIKCFLLINPGLCLNPHPPIPFPFCLWLLLDSLQLSLKQRALNSHILLLPFVIMFSQISYSLHSVMIIVQ